MPARHADATIKVFHKVTLRSDSSLMKNEAPGSLKRCRNQVPVEPSEEEIAIYAYMNWEAEGRPEVPGYKPLGTGRGAIVSPLCSRSIGAIHARATQQTLVTFTSAPETAIHSQA